MSVGWGDGHNELIPRFARRVERVGQRVKQWREDMPGANSGKVSKRT